MPKGTETQPLTAARVIARRLHRAGCRFAFGIPGGEVLTLMDALAETGIRFVLTKHENSAGFMAEGTYHRTGAPGILLATLGPGVANAVNVVANAWQDRVPLIFLTGCVDPADALTYTHQVFDHQALLRPITKASLTAVDGAVDVVVEKALAIALADQPGPVHIDVPIGIAKADQPARAMLSHPRPAPAAPAGGPALEEARTLLRDAERPIMVAGLDVLTHGADRQVRSLAHDFGVPVITTYKAKGVIAEDDPMSLGAAGLSPKADAILLPLVGQADLVLLAGYDPIEMRVGWRSPWPDDAPVVDFTAVPNTHFMHRSRLSFVGDVGAGLAALREGVPPRKTWPAGEPDAARAALATAFAPEPDWGPARVFETVRNVLPRNAIVTADSGAHRILLSQVWQAYEPRTMLQSTALCTMGCAVPLAAGAKLAEPGRPVAAFVGDAGLEMVLGELATVRDLGMPVIIIVLVDESLALIEMKQRKAGLPNVGVDFDGTDFAAVAEALGGHGASVDTVDGLAHEVEAALGRERFTVVACAIGRHAYDGKL